ncbi:MAG: hypothetical protein SGPRY_012346 [Prymnesium sp.]
MDIAFNYAASEGNRDRLSSLDGHKQRRTNLCATHLPPSEEEQKGVEAELIWTSRAHSHASADISLMRSCYDVAAIDASFKQLGLLDESGIAYPMLSEILGEEGCDVVVGNSSLMDGVFWCSELEGCELDCNDLADENGVDQVRKE